MICTPDPAQYNFKASQFTKLKAGFGRVTGATGRARILCVGDSTTEGEGSGTGGKRYQPGSWPSQMADRLASVGIATNKESLFASTGNTGVVTDADLRNSYKPGFNMASPWTQTNGRTMGGVLLTNGTDGTALTYTPQVPVDTFELLDVLNTSAGSISYDVDGGTPVTLNQNGASARRSTIISAGSVGTHTLNVRRVSGSGFLRGVRAWNSTAPAVDVLNAGRCSSIAADWVVTTVPYSSLPVYTEVAAGADLVMIDLTINDATAKTAVATYKAQIQSLIDAAKAGGADVLLMTGNPTDPTLDSPTVQANFRQYMKDLALLNDLPLVDQWARYTDYATMVAAGFMYNRRHPSAAGYADLGTFLADSLVEWTA